jgi:hypothetical protein
MEDFEDVFRRYISRTDLERLSQQLAESAAPGETSLAPTTPAPPAKADGG